MPTCPSCGLAYGSGERFCPHDGTRLPADPCDAAPTPPDPLLGTVLGGRYRIERKLGEGGMGAVYQATHVLMDKLVAVKVLRPELSRDATAARRFHREAKSASRLDHEHCIRVTDFGVSETGLLYLAMEYLEGATLAEELYAKGPLSPGRAVAIARQVCLALAHAHEQGLIHRDLKPDNVFLTERHGRRDFVKVLDFGLAKLLERDDSDVSAGPGAAAVDPQGAGSVTALTQTGIVFGTPEYMSPEQAEGRPLDARTDLYSLGVVLYQLVTGELPFQAASFLGVLTKHVGEAPVPPSERRPDLAIPTALSALIVRCLAKDPALRPTSARELETLLSSLDLTPEPAVRVPAAIAAQPTIGVTAVHLGQEVAEEEFVRASRRGRWLWIAGVSLAAVVAGGAILASQTGTTSTSVATRTIAKSVRPAAHSTLGATEPAAAPRASSRNTGPSPAGPSATGPASPAGPAPTGLSATGPAPTGPSATGPAPTGLSATGPAPTGLSATGPASPAGAALAVSSSPSAAPTPPTGQTGTPSTSGRARAEEHIQLAERHARQGNSLKALFHLQQAIKLEPHHPEALYRLGEALVAAGETARGCEALRRSRHKSAKALYEKVGCSPTDRPPRD